MHHHHHLPHASTSSILDASSSSWNSGIALDRNRNVSAESTLSTISSASSSEAYSYGSSSPATQASPEYTRTGKNEQAQHGLGLGWPRTDSNHSVSDRRILSGNSHGHSHQPSVPRHRLTSSMSKTSKPALRTSLYPSATSTGTSSAYSQKTLTGFLIRISRHAASPELLLKLAFLASIAIFTLALCGSGYTPSTLPTVSTAPLGQHRAEYGDIPGTALLLEKDHHHQPGQLGDDIPGTALLLEKENAEREMHMTPGDHDDTAKRNLRIERDDSVTRAALLRQRAEGGEAVAPRPVIEENEDEMAHMGSIYGRADSIGKDEHSPNDLREVELPASDESTSDGDRRDDIAAEYGRAAEDGDQQDRLQQKTRDNAVKNAERELLELEDVQQQEHRDGDRRASTEDSMPEQAIQARRGGQPLPLLNRARGRTNPAGGERPQARLSLRRSSANREAAEAAPNAFEEHLVMRSRTRGRQIQVRPDSEAKE